MIRICHEDVMEISSKAVTVPYKPYKRRGVGWAFTEILSRKIIPINLHLPENLDNDIIRGTVREAVWEVLPSSPFMAEG